MTNFNFNTLPKNEVELRLTCIEMAMQIVQNGNVDKTHDIVKSAGQILAFATNDGELKIVSESEAITGQILDKVAEYIPMFASAVAPQQEPCTGKCGKKELKSVPTEPKKEE